MLPGGSSRQHVSMLPGLIAISAKYLLNRSKGIRRLTAGF